MSDNIKELRKQVDRLFKEEKWDEIINICTESIQSASDQDYKSFAYNGRGVGYEKKGDLYKAIADYSKSIEVNPKSGKAFYNRGTLYSRKRDYDKAIADYSEAIKLDLKDAFVYYNRGIAYDSKEDYDRAIADYSKAIQRDSEDVLSYFNRGFAYDNKEDYDRAIADYSKVIEINPKDEFAYYNRGIAYESKGDYDRAIADYSEAIELNPKDASSYYRRGISYESKKSYNSAFKDFVECNKHSTDRKSTSPYTYIADRVDNSDLNNANKTNLFKFCIELIDITEEIREELFHESEDNNEIAHYTSLHTLKSLADGDSFRLYNAAYMNDPEEGRVFFEVMKEKFKMDVEEQFYKRDLGVSYASPAYIGSFVDVDKREKDKLFLWRTYGKHEKEEAAGACLIYDTKQFAKELSLLIGKMHQLQRGTGVISVPKRVPELYKVVYKREIESRKDGKVILQTLKDLARLLKSINKFCLSLKGIKKDFVIGLVREILDSVRFLFKVDHYREEREYRVVQMHYYVGNQEQPDFKVDEEWMPPRLYLEMPKDIRFDEVILGPNATSTAQEWELWLKEKGIEKVKKSTVPFKRNDK